MTTIAAGSRHAWAADVAAILAELPAEQAEALRLSYFEHLDEAGIADRMGLTRRQVRSASAEGLEYLGRLQRDQPKPRSQA